MKETTRDVGFAAKQVKAGWRTTEFWMTVTAEVGLVCAASAGVVPPKYAALLMTVSGVAYKISRGLAKS